jgi:glucokinase
MSWADVQVAFILGLDIGGTKLAAGLAADDGRLLSREVIPSRPEEGAEAIIARLLAMARKVIDASGAPPSAIAATGVSCGGPLDIRTGIVREPTNLPGWVDVPLVVRLANGLAGLLGDGPLFLENDANAAAMAEHRYGAGRGVANLVYLTISTGIGGGVIIEDRVIEGESGNAAEIGHMSMAHDGWPCPCGSRGCLEAFASGTNIARRARERMAGGERSSLAGLMTGAPDTITAREVAAAARAGDALACAVWDETVAVLGAAVGSIINIFNPRLVILGGGVTAVGDQLIAPVRRIALDRAFPSMAAEADVVIGQLGADIGVMGAVAAAQSRLANRDPHLASWDARPTTS